MATPVVGTLGSFDSTVETWEQYAERMGHFFAANDITDGGRQRSILLSEVGPVTYTIISSLLSPEKPGAKSFSELVELLKTHFNPEPSEIVERFKFHTRIRQQNETVGQFVTELRAIARYCNFKDTLNEALRDRIVCGINDDAVQRRLLAEKKLDLPKALDIATGMETAKHNLTELHESTTAKRHDTAVFKVRSESTCYRCNGTSHTADKCRCKTAKCHQCGKLGHVQRACRSAPIDTGHRSKRKKSTQRAQTVQQLSTHTINQVKGENPLQANVTINEKELAMEVDTGASVTLMSYSQFQTLWPQAIVRPTNCVLKTYFGEQIPIKGEVDVTVEHNQQKLTLPLLLVGTEGPALLGRNWLERMKLDWRNILQIRKEISLDQILTNNTEVFTDELGKVCGVKASIYIEPNATPKFMKARSVPYAMKENRRTVDEIDETRNTRAGRICRMGYASSTSHQARP